ncbi:MAG: hypothetical protein HWN66_10485 [Candidatus Helarchaeota archaeon]|nr:hypothetical protein [Candidatus Helarchaeota archaeon]
MIWSFFLILTELVNFQPTGKCIYSQKFGQLDDDSPLITKFIGTIPSLEDYDSGNQLVGKIQFIYSGYNDLLFVACADKTDNAVSLAQAIENMKIAFAQKFFNLIKEGKDAPSLFTPFKEDVDKAIAALSPPGGEITTHPGPATVITPLEKVPTAEATKRDLIKIAFVGSKNTGKRTILNLLFTGSADSGSLVEESDMMMKKGPISDNYNALLITIPNDMIESGKTQFLSNTDVVIFVTNSVFKDIMATRKIYDTIKPTLSNARYGVIANKQDMTGVVEPDAISKVYELPIIPMIGVDSANYEMLKTFIIELIEGA